ncbi:hypothetical protein GCM10012275_47980 [Longimycelium tulufanense]|uniref:DUF4142 domain-containing protein n=1 Tax=Longimycelium tulufanense TaxID=907463 RepID=A0A8J3FYG6_9PSEU|nr:hypothetical protein GCM10012275_47980 [Longimycelium tulufanense]
MLPGVAAGHDGNTNPTPPDVRNDKVVPLAQGVLNDDDRTLLKKVRLAGLWELPMAKEAPQHNPGQRTREVAKHLVADHEPLDVQTRKLAAKLGVPIPDEPAPEQKEWMAELRAASGPEFDRIFAKRLRAAHGQVYIVAAKVRAGTKNNDMRAFAQTAVNLVGKHMALLESTGLVDGDSLVAGASSPTPTPEATTPEATGSASTASPKPRAVSSRDDGGMNIGVGLVVAILLVVVGVAATLGIVRLLQTPGKSSR